MQFKQLFCRLKTGNSWKLGAAGLVAVGLATVGLTGAQAAGSPTIPDRSIYHIDIAAGAVGSDTIANRAIQSYDMNRALVNALLAVPTNGVDSSKVKDGSLNERDLDAATKTKLNAVGTGQPGKSYGCDGKVVDADHPAATCPGTPGEKGEKGDPATDVKGGTVAEKTWEPTVVAKIGGRFADNATLVGTITIPKGTVKIDLDGFWTTNAVGPEGTRPQLALRAGSVDGGTIFPGEASPAKDREITGHSTKKLTLTEDTEFSVYAFGYNDDQSANGGGRLVVTPSIVVTAA